MWDWLMMAIKKPKAFCWSHTADQAAFSILALNRSLPLANLLVYGADKRETEQANNYVNRMKHVNHVLDTIAKGEYETVAANDYDRLPRVRVDRTVCANGGPPC